MSGTQSAKPNTKTTTARVAAPARDAADAKAERSLRPRRLSGFVGQAALKDALHIVMHAAQGRQEPVDHLLFYGPPGLGKTTLAGIVAAEMGVSLRATSGPAIARPGDLAGILTTLESGDVLFIDEIHRLPRGVEEMLYPAMEDFALDLMIGKGPGARSVRLAIKPFTLIGATTRYAMIGSPLRDRFGAVHRLDFYTVDDLVLLLAGNARRLAVEVAPNAALVLARSARGTPRIANRLLRRVRDYAQVKAAGAITTPVAEAALERLHIDALGLDERDRELLRLIIERFDGGPVGLETIAASLAEESDTVMDVHEPYLMQLGFMHRTARGRVVSAAAYEHLGIAAPAGAGRPDQQASLFMSDAERVAEGPSAKQPPV